MIIGVPRELTPDEYRVAVTPAGVRELVSAGNTVVVESQAGAGSGYRDGDYEAAGAATTGDAGEVWGACELVCKVKEPVAAEYRQLREELVLFTFLHLAANRPCTEALLAAGTTAIAYETVRRADGTLPLLAPMSDIAGRMAPLVGAELLQRPKGGRGMLVSGVPGVPAASVVVLGAGVAGMAAARLAVGMGARVLVLDKDPAKLHRADERFGGRLATLAASAAAIEASCLDADLVVGAVLVAGARAPHLVPNTLVEAMAQGAVLVDIAVDQGGCFEASRPTTHHAPTFEQNGALYYCVANMPGAVPVTATQALANATLPYLEAVAEKGWREAARADRSLAEGVNITAGDVVCEAVAEAHGLTCAALVLDS